VFLVVCFFKDKHFYVTVVTVTGVTIIDCYQADEDRRTKTGGQADERTSGRRTSGRADGEQADGRTGGQENEQ